jgi:hypothetical protein
MCMAKASVHERTQGACSCSLAVLSYWHAALCTDHVVRYACISLQQLQTAAGAPSEWPLTVQEETASAINSAETEVQRLQQECDTKAKELAALQVYTMFTIHHTLR